MAKISRVHARQILDSRGNPTVEAEILLDNGVSAIASVPSGASTGTREALELRDHDPKIYKGKSVTKAIRNINQIIAPLIQGVDVTDQKKIDQLMIDCDGTENKEKLGANAMLAVSLACARAGSVTFKMPLFKYLREKLNAPLPKGSKKYILPAPLMNIINGGEHASNNLDIQEFMIIPSVSEHFSENLRAGVEIFHTLKSVLAKKGLSTNVGDEGGFAPNLNSHDQALELILQSIDEAGYQAGENIFLALDAAASEFCKNDLYEVEGSKLNTDQMIDYLSGLADKYPIYSIEDGLSEHDKDGWTKLTQKIGSKVLTVGDDLFVTNKKILKVGIEKQQANSILIKVNQIGTLSETFETLDLAYKNDFKAIISHRSGETSDSFIADLAVACNAGHIKTGSASRSDRLAKYNQLLRIEEFLGGEALYNKI
jgi:enolase